MTEDYTDTTHWDLDRIALIILSCAVAAAFLWVATSTVTTIVATYFSLMAFGLAMLGDRLAAFIFRL